MSKTVRVRIAVSVDPTGEWSAAGWSGLSDKEAHGYTIDTLAPGERRYWIEADLEVPEPLTIEGVATEAGE